MIVVPRPSHPGCRRPAETLRCVCVAALVVALTACAGAPPADREPPVPSLDDLAVGEWRSVVLRGDARCADGSEYAIQVLPGDRDELLVVFQGGGATWGELQDLPLSLRLTFSRLGVPLYTSRVTNVGTLGLAGPPPGAAVHGATQVVISYCSGDVHWGDAPIGNVDQRGRFVQQRGVDNVLASLAWLEAQDLAPARVGLVGCSAGAYGALLWAPSVQGLYPAAQRSVLLDAGVGVVQAPFLVRGADPPRGLEAWRAERAFERNGVAHLLDGLGLDYYLRLLEAVAEVFDGPIGVASTDRDVVQTLFWYLMGEDFDGFPSDEDELDAFARDTIDDWSTIAVERLDAAAAISGVSTFVSSWTPASQPDVGDGSGHCITTDGALWSSAGEGAAFRGWWDALRSGEVPDPVDVRP